MSDKFEFEPSRDLMWNEAAMVVKCYLEQEDPLAVDELPYTDQIKAIAEIVGKKYPKRGWTERMVYKTLLRLRKTGHLPKIFRPQGAPAEDSEAA